MSNVASSVLMIEPNTFGFDEQTARSNAFAHDDQGSRDIKTAARREFAAVVKALREFGVEVMTYAHSDDGPRPNAIFPNNWLTTWPDGRVYLYPMATQSRRVERDEVVLTALQKHYGVSKVTDISSTEDSHKYLESTGAIVFDHAGKVAYGCASLRCDGDLFGKHVRGLGYEPVLFDATDGSGLPIYHTNVMMGVQSTTAVLGTEAIRDTHERRRVVKSLEQTGHTVVEISEEQMRAYCGNVIELANVAGERCLLLSQSAYDAFTSDQREVLGRDKILLPVAVPTIQEIGGGSVRCMVAEIFLPRVVTETVLTPRS